MLPQPIWAGRLPLAIGSASHWQDYAGAAQARSFGRGRRHQHLKISLACNVNRAINRNLAKLRWKPGRRIAPGFLHATFAAAHGAAPILRRVWRRARALSPQFPAGLAPIRRDDPGETRPHEDRPVSPPRLTRSRAARSE